MGITLVLIVVIQIALGTVITSRYQSHYHELQLGGCSVYLAFPAERADQKHLVCNANHRTEEFQVVSKFEF